MSDTIPKTAGRTLSEGELRAFTKCSEFFHRGGIVKENFGTRVVKGTVERLIVLSLQNKIKKPLKDLEACLLESLAEVNQTENILSSKLTRYMHTCLLWLKEFLEILPLDRYEPVLGKLTPKIQISLTPIQLEISGILRSKKNQTIHIVDFGAFASRHSLLNDPCAILKLKLLSPLVREEYRSKRPKAVIHIFAFGKNSNLQYYTYSTNDMTKERFSMVETLVKCIEMGHHFPVVPCLYQCPFKENCFPGVSDA